MAYEDTAWEKSSGQHTFGVNVSVCTHALRSKSLNGLSFSEVVSKVAIVKSRHTAGTLKPRAQHEPANHYRVLRCVYCFIAITNETRSKVERSMHDMLKNRFAIARFYLSPLDKSDSFDTMGIFEWSP